LVASQNRTREAGAPGTSPASPAGARYRTKALANRTVRRKVRSKENRRSPQTSGVRRPNGEVRAMLRQCWDCLIDRATPNALPGNVAVDLTLENPRCVYHPNWGWAWPMNRRVLYNRASCDVSDKPWNSSRALRWNEEQKEWVGNDLPDFRADSPLKHRTSPFIIHAEAVGRIFAPLGGRPVFSASIRAGRICEKLHLCGTGRTGQCLIRPYALLFFLGILAPASRASLRAMATACLRLVTFLRPPDFSVPCLYSCITFSVFARPLVDDEVRFLEAVFFAIGLHWLDTGRAESVSTRGVVRCHQSRRRPDVCLFGTKPKLTVALFCASATSAAARDSAARPVTPELLSRLVKGSGKLASPALA